MLLVQPAGAAGVHQWRDAQGRLHFGDQPPQSEQTTDLSKKYDNRLPFNVLIEGVDYAVPPSLRSHISISVQKIFTIYQHALKTSYSNARDFRIVIYGSEQAYRRYQRKVAPVLENSAGFYSSENNQITTWGMNQNALMALITHEVSHVISASDNRWLPTWINEGLAEYFEGMHVSGLMAEIRSHGHWLRMLKQAHYHNRDPDLQRYLAVAHQDWYQADGGDSSLSYATSWSLVFFLMDSSNGRRLLQALLERSRNSPVPLRNSTTFINQRWPGGMAALTTDWQSWLGKTQRDRHRY